MGGATTIIIQHTFTINLGSPIVEAKEINILTPSEEKSPCIPKSNSLFQLFK